MTRQAPFVCSSWAVGAWGEALFAGLIASGAEQAETIVVVEPLAVRRDELRTAHPGLVVSDAPVSAPTVVAVKPQDVRAAVGAAVGACHPGTMADGFEYRRSSAARHYPQRVIRSGRDDCGESSRRRH